jgi:hypothetical protein
VRRPALVVLIQLLVLVSPAAAQGRTVRGVVLDTANRPVAAVNISTRGAAAVTDDSGRFMIQLPSKDRARLDVRRVGFMPSRFGISAGGDTTIEMVLFPTAQELEKVTVKEREPASAALRGFQDRLGEKEKGINNGYFITEKEIEQRSPGRTSQLFEGVPSVYVVKGTPDGRTEWVITGRRLAGIATNRRDSGPSRCGFTIYLDGVRLNIPKEDRLTGRDTSTVVIDDFVNPLSIAGIEIYSRPTDAPSRFQLLNGSCGVALIWTKRS